MFRVFLNLRSTNNFRNGFSCISYRPISKITSINNYLLKFYNCKRYSTENEDESDDYTGFESETLDFSKQTRHVTFNNCFDIVSKQLNDCLSVEDVWNLIEKYKNELTGKQLVNIIIVLQDLQNNYSKANCSVDNASFDFLNELKKSTNFSNLMNFIIHKLDILSPELLSYVFLYLHKLGMQLETYPMILLAERLQKDLLDNFDISVCSRWINVIFLEKSARPYYMSIDLIPKVFNYIDKCESIEDLESVSVCLSKLQIIVTDDIVRKYVDKVESFLQNGIISNFEYGAILRIITFLSLPAWKDQNSNLISRCMILIKNQISKLDTQHLLLLYEIFFKIQEPGEILNEIQRNAAKFWQQFEETGNLNTNTALKLFSALMYFNSPLQKIHARKDITRLLKPKMTPGNLVILRKIFSYVKLSDKNICDNYWNLWSNIVEEDGNISFVVQACDNYMLFNTDLNYRNYTFEKTVLELIKNLARTQVVMFPSHLPTLLNFVLWYGQDNVLLEVILNKVRDNPLQLRNRNFFLVSKALEMSKIMSKQQYIDIRDVLKESSQYFCPSNENRFERNIYLIKAAILRNEYDNYDTDALITEFKDLEYMSSKLLGNINYIFMNTDSLIPEVFNKITEYILKNRHSIVGFNAEKTLFLCFHLAYVPINGDKFFQTVTDIIIRDQERLSGLALLQSALSLSFFNKLPSFVVKQIFNVEFMDRLDNELANCYSKEIYPHRVRQTLMYLNRTVCLEYPQFNIPWFHDKYLKDIQKRYISDATDLDFTITKSIKEHLIEIVHGKIMEDVITPYGYHINFVLNLDKAGNVVPSSSSSIIKRVALLLIRQHAFTRFYTHLKGNYQMKIRHLEMLGYSVSILKLDDWTNLLYATERLDYLKKLIWSKSSECNHYTVKR